MALMQNMRLTTANAHFASFPVDAALVIWALVAAEDQPIAVSMRGTCVLFLGARGCKVDLLMGHIEMHCDRDRNGKLHNHHSKTYRVLLRC